MSEKLELKVPEAPDFLFKNERTGVILNEKCDVYLIEKMEAVEHFGMCIYYKNVPYPKKGFPSPDELYALNQIKRIVLEGSRHAKNPFFILGIIFTDKTELLKSFNSVFSKLFGRFVMKDEFMCRSAFNFANFIHGTLISMGIDNSLAKEFAFNLGQIIEYDDAYRYRFQDIMEELDEEQFNKNPKKEVLRLYEILIVRALDGVAFSKVKPILTFVNIFVPFIKKHLIKNTKFLKECCRDQSDWYWTCIRNDNYLYNGMSKDECHSQFKERPISYEVMA